MGTIQITPVTWAEQSTLSTTERDCVTAVVLKILDNKCKMSVEQQEAMLAIYETLCHQPGKLFDQATYECIEQACRQHQMLQTTADRIHQYRLSAEQKIPKPVMKAFKARLRAELFEKI